ncbi:MAG: MBL fold metallo-hydrolase [bacterium]|nr:MBL fold metallo-hydrolase [bacterium]MDT8396912.1 MBL fold metallo-hydrolase [bacterium]
MGKLVVEHLAVGPLQSNCFIVGDEISGEAVVIDPGEDGEMILAAVRRRPWTVRAVLNTHAHFDHIAANEVIVKETGAPLVAPRADAPYMPQAHMAARMYGLVVAPSPDPDRLIDEGDVIIIGDEEIGVLSTPGHTPGGVTFVTSAGVFPGDALFAGSIGRTDLPGGDYQTLIISIRKKILTLPDETPVYPGHGPFTTVGREKNLNPFLT